VSGKAAVKLPPADHLRECLSYDADSGVLVWKVRPLHHFKNAHGMNTFNAKFAGKVATSLLNGRYLTVSIGGRTLLAHRVIWKMVTGDEPPPFVDHKDTDKLNNRFSNLRPATKQQNAFNTGVSSKNNTGFKGVSYDRQRGKYYACIRVNGKSKSLGRFDSAEQAGQAYQQAAQRAHGEFARYDNENP
jgi:hypothetical protein